VEGGITMMRGMEIVARLNFHQAAAARQNAAYAGVSFGLRATFQ
jgi:hypothetical protein